MLITETAAGIVAIVIVSIGVIYSAAFLIGGLLRLVYNIFDLVLP